MPFLLRIEYFLTQFVSKCVSYSTEICSPISILCRLGMLKSFSGKVFLVEPNTSIKVVSCPHPIIPLSDLVTSPWNSFIICLVFYII